MKKVLVILLLVIVVIAGGVVYLASGANDFIAKPFKAAE